MPASYVLPLPENVPLDVGALVEPLSVAWHAISAAPLDESSTVLVLGGGPIGLAVVQCLAAKKVKKIIMSEVAPARQQFAREFGAHHVLDPRENDLVAMTKELSDENGADVVFDCAGVPARYVRIELGKRRYLSRKFRDWELTGSSITTACQSVKSRGTVVNVAIWEKAVPFNPNMLVFREAKLTAVLGYQRKDFEAVIEALGSGMTPSSHTITHWRPLMS